MVGRRFGPLMGMLIFALFGVLVRTARIQVAEHEVWAKEAVNLERRSSLIPYQRGKIYARGGELLVEDEERYSLTFQWREFRRENPIGQVALATAAWTGTQPHIIHDPDELGEQALWLLKLSPADLAMLASSSSGREDGEEAVMLRRRAADAGYYLRRVVGLEPRAEGRLRQLMSKKDETRSILELAGEASGRDSIEGDVLFRCWQALDDLARLELLLEYPRGWLVNELEERGEEVADAVASRMFAKAVGFSAGRLEPTALARWDLQWLRRSLGWNEEREALWRERARDNWREWVLSLEAPEAALRASSSEDERSFGALLSFLSPVFSSEGASDYPWMVGLGEGHELELFQLKERPRRLEPAPIFLSGSSEGSRGRAVMLQALEDARLSAMELGDWEEEWQRAEFAAWSPPEDLDEAIARWERGRREERLRLSQWFATRWSLEWERGWSHLLNTVDAGEGAALNPQRVKSALDDRDHCLKDLGRRAHLLEADPAYEAVFLLTRYPERFRGFGVKTRMRRTTNGRLLAQADPLWRVIGHARTMTLEDSLDQEDDREEFGDLRMALRSERDDASLRRLVQTLTRQDEQHGADGIERLMDSELAGENGYREREGLAERSKRGAGVDSSDMLPIHGEDVHLTIDLALQHAASEVINNPDPTDDGRFLDEAWFASPIGAICLITPGGEILAAASAPSGDLSSPIPHRDGQGAFAHERTLRRYTGLPVGSVFKPFAALWCLEEGLVMADQQFSCVPRERDGRLVAGYHSVNCHRSSGHGQVMLRGALRVSCNAYFAQLGDRIGSREGLMECAHTFGFDLPTGVNHHNEQRGIREDYRNPSFHKKAVFTSSDLERGANGLTVMEGTPLQVARAFASIATGELPTLTFTRGESSFEAEPLPIAELHLEVVRAALIDVANRGSAQLLSKLDVAVKTGSADYLPMNDEVAAQLQFPLGAEPSSRKHTWVAGWTPAESPRLIFVVYLHDIGVTSSHSAVFLARQLLERPEVRAYLAEGGL